jgi:hypothetical protein
MQQRAAVMEALFRGHSMSRSTRLTGVAKNRIRMLVMELGAACVRYLISVF